jgi:hypothetical protein
MIDACKWLRMKHGVYGIERKNPMERDIHPAGNKRHRTQNVF